MSGPNQTSSETNGETSQACASLMVVAVQLHRLGLVAHLEPGAQPELQVGNPVSVGLVTSVHVAGGCFVGFGGIVLSSSAEPQAAAVRLGHLLGLISV